MVAGDIAFHTIVGVIQSLAQPNNAIIKMKKLIMIENDKGIVSKPFGDNYNQDVFFDELFVSPLLRITCPWCYQVSNNFGQVC